MCWPMCTCMHNSVRKIFERCYQKWAVHTSVHMYAQQHGKNITVVLLEMGCPHECVFQVWAWWSEMTADMVGYMGNNLSFYYKQNEVEAQWAIAVQQPMVAVTNVITEGGP